MLVERLNPDTLHRNPAFSQAVVVRSGAKLIFVGGQNGVNRDGYVVGKDIATQTAHAFGNLRAVLEAAGATLDDIIKMTITIVEGQSLQAGFVAAGSARAMMSQPPAISVIIAAGLAHPDYLIEVEAVAAVDEGRNL